MLRAVHDSRIRPALLPRIPRFIIAERTHYADGENLLHASGAEVAPLDILECKQSMTKFTMENAEVRKPNLCRLEVVELMPFPGMARKRQRADVQYPYLDNTQMNVGTATVLLRGLNKTCRKSPPLQMS